MSEYYITGTNIRTYPRHTRNGYEERLKNRMLQSGPAGRAKDRTYLAGRARPPAAGVGIGNESKWTGTWVPVKNETRMRGRGNRR